MYSFLVVDDEHMICKSTCLMLERLDLPVGEIKGAGDGKEALAYLDEKLFDFVVTDIRMPKMDGLELCGEISKRWPETCVLIVSGYDDFKYAQQALKYGVKDYILKPVDPKDLAKTIREIIKNLKTDRPRFNESHNHIEANTSNPTVNAAIRYIEQHYNEDISLDDLGTELNLNSCYFSQFFKQKTGKTFVAYRTDVRIRNAMTLLSTSGKTVTEVAFDAGYQSSNHFIRAFKKYTGMSPTEFREKREAGK